MTLPEFIATALRMLDLPDDPDLIIPSYTTLLALLDDSDPRPGTDIPGLRRRFIDACIVVDQTVNRTMPHLTS